MRVGWSAFWVTRPGALTVVDEVIDRTVNAIHVLSDSSLNGWGRVENATGMAFSWTVDSVAQVPYMMRTLYGMFYQLGVILFISLLLYFLCTRDVIEGWRHPHIFPTPYAHVQGARGAQQNDAREAAAVGTEPV